MGAIVVKVLLNGVDKEGLTTDVEGVSMDTEGVMTGLNGVVIGVVDGGVNVVSFGKGLGVTSTEDKLAAREVFSERVRVMNPVELSHGKITEDCLAEISFDTKPVTT